MHSRSRARSLLLAVLLVSPLSASLASAGSAPPAAPQGLNASPGPDAGTILLNWSSPLDDPSPATAWNVSRFTNGTWVPVGTTNQTRFTDTPTPGEHTYEVVGVNAAGEGPAANATGFTRAPAAPTGFLARAGPDAGNVTLTWDVLPSGSRFHLYRSSSGGSAEFLVDLDTTSYVDSPGAPGSTFDYTLNATTTQGESDSAFASARAPIHGAPTGFALLRGPNLGGIQLTWAPPSLGAPPAGYTVHRLGGAPVLLQETSTPKPSVTDIPVGNNLSFNDTDLAQGVNETYWVSSDDDGVDGAATSERTGVPASLPDAPVDATLSRALTVGKFQFAWRAPTDDGGAPVTGYRIDERLNASSDPVLWVGPNATGATILVAADGARHDYELLALTRLGASNPAPLSADAVWAPSTPLDVSTRPGVLPGDVNLTWAPPAADNGAPVSYHVWRLTYRSGSISPGLLPPFTTNNTTFVDATGAPGVRQAYHVSAFNTAGDGANSSDVTEIARPDLIPCPAATSTTRYVCAPLDFAWRSLDADAGVLRLVDDNATSPLPIGFNFSFYGRDYDAVSITSNGMVQFNRTEGHSEYRTRPIPDPTDPNNYIAAYWVDLYPPAGEHPIRFETLGTSPHREFVVEYDRVPEYLYERGNATMQIVLHEDGLIEIQLRQASLTDPEHAATIGIEDAAGENGVMVKNGNFAIVEQGFGFLPPALPTEAPTNLTAVQGTPSTSIQLSWNAPPGAADAGVFRYVVYRAAGVEPMLRLAESNVLAYTDANLANGTYTYEIAALNARGEGPHSAPANATAMVPTPPGPPASYAPNVTTSPALPTGLNGWFNTSVNASATLPEGDTRSANLTLLEGDIIHASPFLVPEGTHILVAQASDGNGGSGSSAPVELRVDLTPPTVAVTDLVADRNISVRFGFSEPMDLTTTSAALSVPEGWKAEWTADLTVLFVNVSRAADGTSLVALTSGATDAHGNHLVAGASRSYGFSAPAPPPPPPPPPARPPGAPSSLVALLSGHTASLSWSTPSDPGTNSITGYRLYRSTDGASAMVLANPSGLSATDPSLEAGHSYTYSVSAMSSVGESARSVPASVTVPASTPPTSSLSVAAPDGQGGIYLTSPLAALNATPAGAIIKVALDGAAETVYAGPIAIPAGTHTLSWHAELAGEPSEAPHSQAFVVDLAPPTIGAVSYNATSAELGHTVRVSVHVTDDASAIASVTAILPGGVVALSGADGNYAGDLGANTVGTVPVTIRATDAAGRESSANGGTFTMTAPVVENTTPTEPTPIPTPANDTTSAPTTSTAAPTPAGSEGSSGGSTFTPTSTGSSPSSSGGTPLEPASASPSPASPSETSAATETPTPVVEVTQDPTVNASLSAGARGQVIISAHNLPHPEKTRFVVVSSDGHETPLPSSGTEATWDTTQNEDGYYTVEAREARDDGSEFTIASTTVQVRNVFMSAAAAAGSVLVGAGAAAAASAATSAFASSGLGAAAATASSASSAGASAATSGGTQGFSFVQYLKDLFTDAGSDALRDRTKNVADIERRRKIRSAIAVVLTVALIAVFYTFADTSSFSWAAYAATLPIVGAAAVLLALQKYGSESLIAHLSGARVRFRIWVAGVASLLLSTVVFRSPFGYPGYVDNGEEVTTAEKRLAGHRALAILGITSAWGLIFVALSHLGYYALGAVGLAMALGALATACMPFGPLAGAEVWRWNKMVAVATAIAGFGLYVTYEMALLPEAVILGVGVVGAAGYVLTTMRLRNHAKPPRSIPVHDADTSAQAKKGTPEAREV